MKLHKWKLLKWKWKRDLQVAITKMVMVEELRVDFPNIYLILYKSAVVFYITAA